MFKKPFSFDGRIGRTEYCLSYFGYFAILVVLGATFPNTDMANLLQLILLIPLIWFLLAQGAKRCHDRGNFGGFQIIPFYLLWMMFAPGDPGENEYGPSPKQPAEQRV
ncbi:DUF805 domain-containing protein [Dyadobacter helix]|nr:DUF805 domain-containing protein [Dyadobacter sp. CECT 9275]